MTKSSPIWLISLGVIGVGLGFAIELGLARLGRGMFQLEIVFSVVLILLAAALIGLAWPVRTMVKDPTAKRVNPFWAIRVLLLAQASGYAAALMAGFAAGILLWATTKIGLPSSVFWVNGFALVSGVALLIAALIAENFCRIPPDDDQQVTSGSTPTTPA